MLHRQNDTKQPVILLVGLGSIGRRHLKNLRTIFPDAFILVYRHWRSPSEEPIIAQYADKVVYELEEVFPCHPIAAIICNPATFHIEIALKLAEHNIHLFIEKPLSHDLSGIYQLIEICRHGNLVLMVGYNLRFVSGLRKMKQLIEDGRIGELLSLQVNTGQYLPDWRQDKDYRECVSARHDLGGGVLLELSHEFDYVCWLMGKPTVIFAKASTSGCLECDVEDMADILIEFSSGSEQKRIANIHLDMIQRPPVRECLAIGSHGKLIWNANEQILKVYTLTADTVEQEQYDVKEERDDAYLSELRHFFDCVLNQKQPLISGEDGRTIVALVLAAKKASQTGKAISL